MDSKGILHGAPLYAPEEILSRLKARFPDEVVEQKPGGNKQLDYIPGWAVEERLDHATGGVWSFELLWNSSDTIKIRRNNAADRDEYGNVTRKVEYAFGRLTIPGLGSRCGRGVQVLDDGSGEDIIKGAETDALKVAAAKFGVARYLYQGGQHGSSQTSTYSDYDNSAPQQNNYGAGGPGGSGPRKGDPPTEAQWAKFNGMTQRLGIDPNSIIREATNGFNMANVNKRGMSMTLDKLERIENKEETWNGPQTEASDGGNSGRFDGGYVPPAQRQQQAPAGNVSTMSGAPLSGPNPDTINGMLQRIKGAQSGSELDMLYDEMVALMISDDVKLMQALSARANEIGG